MGWPDKPLNLTVLQCFVHLSLRVTREHAGSWQRTTVFIYDCFAWHPDNLTSLKLLELDKLMGSKGSSLAAHWRPAVSAVCTH